MRKTKTTLNEMINHTSPAIKREVDWEFAISNKIYALMEERGLNQKMIAEALGKRPSEVTKWLSGQHNFTLRTLSMLSTYFGVSLVTISD